MTNKEKYLKIQEIFDDIYSDADCTLDYEDPFHLLVAVQLAAQCTDARVNLVTPALFKRLPDVYAFAKAEINEIEELIKSTGFFRNKAKNLKGCAEKIINEFGGEVPDNMEDLLSLPGVGRKTANLIMGDVYGKGGVVVDTHCKRITKKASRLGLLFLSFMRPKSSVQAPRPRILRRARPPPRYCRNCRPPRAWHTRKAVG